MFCGFSCLDYKGTRMFNTTMLRLIVVFAIAMSSTNSLEFPSNFQQCKRTDNDFNDCLKSAIQDVLPKLANGLPDFKFPSIEPLHTSSMTAKEGTGAVRFEQEYTNIELSGISSATVNSASAEMNDNKMQLRLDLTMQKVVFYADYHFDGQILIVDVVGQGKITVILKETQVILQLNGNEIKKGGADYYEFKDSTLSLAPNHVEFIVENLFEGDETLGKEMNILVNDNWSEVWEDVAKEYEELYGNIYQDLANIIFSQIPHEKIFPL